MNTTLSASTTTGAEIHALAARLYPICRSITGEGLRETLRIVREYIPIEVQEARTGERAFDWTVPREWNIRAAYIRRLSGEPIVDFTDSNLHVLNYSTPIRARLSREELLRHCHTDPGAPDRVPYRTSYYAENWGFCLTQRQLDSLTDPEYDVVIDSSLTDGALNYGELLLPGVTSEEVLVHTHCCHPSLANDNLSGIAVAVHLARSVAAARRRYSYRFLFMPGSIGAVVWLARNRERASRIRHGLVLTCVGDQAGFHYKKTRHGNAESDRAMIAALKQCGEPFQVLDFSPWGYDERQYESPGFKLPIGCLMRSVHGTFPEYHTSADNLDFIRPEKLERSLGVCLAWVDALERNATYVNLNPFCEPMLGRRGLYPSMGGVSADQWRLALLWVLNQSDGTCCLLDIAERSGLQFSVIADAAAALETAGLLRRSDQWYMPGASCPSASTYSTYDPG